MERDPHYKQDILDAIVRIQKITRGMRYDSFRNNDVVSRAVLYDLIIIGEAAKRLSSLFKKRYIEVPWKNIAGFRDKAVHDYSTMNVAVVWDTITGDLPFLYSELTKNDEPQGSPRKRVSGQRRRT